MFAQPEDTLHMNNEGENVKTGLSRGGMKSPCVAEMEKFKFRYIMGSHT